MFTLKTARTLAEIPESIITLLQQSFSYIHDRASADAYFFQRGGETTIYWLEFEGKPIAHYALITMAFLDHGKRIIAGKPELNIVDKNFLKTCMMRKLNYAVLDPLGILSKKIHEDALAQGISFLFTWPNDMAMPFYRRQGYQEKNIPVTLYAKFFAVHRFGRSLKTFTLFEPQDAAYAGAGIIPERTPELLNLRFGKQYFERYRLGQTGYIVIKNDDGLQKVVDTTVAEQELLTALALVPRTSRRGILYRKYGDSFNIFSALTAGLIPYKKITRTLMYKKIKDIDIDSVVFSDMCSDYSM